MKLSEPGMVVSGAAHAAVLAIALLAFNDARDMGEVHEAVPIETISDKDFNQIMKGDKTSKDVKPQPSLKAEKVADATEPKPDTPVPPALRDVATAPPPPLQQPDPTPPPPPPPPAPEPPPRPAELQPPAPTPPPAPLPPRRVQADAETIAPLPPPVPPKHPDPPKPEVKPPRPPEVPKHVEAKTPPPPKPRPKPQEPVKLTPVEPEPVKPDPPKPDLLAKLLDMVPKPQPVAKLVPRPKAAETEPDPSRFDPTDISRFLSKEAPSRTASTGAQVSRVSTAGAANAHDTSMSPSLWDALDGLLEDQYKQCWSYLGIENTKYIPQIKVVFAADGSLTRDPVLVNPPSDPGMRSLAESALRAVRKCNPLRIPAQFAPYYDEWKGRVLRFDPVDMAG